MNKEFATRHHDTRRRKMQDAAEHNESPENKNSKKSVINGVEKCIPSGQALGTMTTIYDLPKELLTQILLKLTVIQRIRIEPVCSRWKQVLEKHCFVDVTSLSYEAIVKIDDEKKKYPLGEWTSMHISTLLRFAGNNLLEFDLNSFFPFMGENSSIGALVPQVFRPSLNLNLSTLVANRTDIKLGKVALATIGKCLPNLQRAAISVNCVGNGAKVEQGFRLFIEGCVFLKHLELRVVSVSNALNNCRTFPYSNLLPASLLSFRLDDPWIQETSFVCIGKTCPKLEKLELKRCFGLTARAMNLLLQNLSSLTHLRIPNLHFSTDEIFDLTGFGSLHNLRSLSILDSYDIISDTFLDTLAKNCLFLEKLELSFALGNNRITREGLLLLGAMPNLIELTLVDVIPGEQMSVIDFMNIVLEAISRNGKLQSLDVSMVFSREMLDASFVQLLKRCKLSLKTLKCGLAVLSETAVRSLANVPNLTTLVLRGESNKNLSDETLSAISTHGKLEVLDIERCKNVTDASLFDVLNHCKSLQSLNVRRCPAATSQLLRAIKVRKLGKSNDVIKIWVDAF